MKVASTVRKLFKTNDLDTLDTKIWKKYFKFIWKSKKYLNMQTTKILPT